MSENENVFGFWLESNNLADDFIPALNLGNPIVKIKIMFLSFFGNFYLFKSNLIL